MKKPNSQVVQECVAIWFGSETAFIESVQKERRWKKDIVLGWFIGTCMFFFMEICCWGRGVYGRQEVLSMLKKDLSGRAFTAEWALGVTIPCIWCDMDFAASFARQKLWDRAASFLIDGFVVVFLVVPPMAKVMIQICRLLRRKMNSCWREVCLNLLVMLLCGIPIFIALALWMMSSYMIYVPVSSNGGSPLLASATFFVLMVLQSTCSHFLAQWWMHFRWNTSVRHTGTHRWKRHEVLLVHTDLWYWSCLRNLLTSTDDTFFLFQTCYVKIL